MNARINTDKVKTGLANLSQRNEKKFEKTLDKLKNLWYNKYVIKREQKILSMIKMGGDQHQSRKARKENTMTKTTMNSRIFFSTIANDESISQELRDFASKSLAQMDKEQASRKAKNSSAKQAENAPLVAKVAELLASGKPMTASEIAVALEVSASKATVLAKAVPNVIIGEAVNKGRIIKAYSLSVK